MAQLQNKYYISIKLLGGGNRGGIVLGLLIGFIIIIIFLMSFESQLRRMIKQNEQVIELLKKLTEINK